MKSHVSVEQQRCAVCAKDYDTGTILLDKRLRQSLERTTVTGWGLCPEHQKLYEDGYIALVAADEAKSDKLPNGTITPDGAYRTGTVLHMKIETFNRVFNVSGRGNNGKPLPMVFCGEEVIAKVQALVRVK